MAAGIMCSVPDTTQPEVPQGWYHDHIDVLRWWDGAGWGPAAPPPSDTGDSRTWGMLAHLGLLLLWFVGPLVIRQTVGRTDAFVRKHATESLNANLTLIVYWNAGPLLGWVLAEVTGKPAWKALSAGMAVAFVWIAVTAVRGARSAYHGKPYRYPAIVRMVPGGWPTLDNEDAVVHAPR